LKFVNFILSAA